MTSYCVSKVLNTQRLLKVSCILYISILFSTISQTYSETVIPPSACFTTLPIPILAAGNVLEPASSEASQSEDDATTGSISRICIPGTLLCPIEVIDDDDDGPRRPRFTTKPPEVPTKTVFFIADSSDTCVFWRCIGRGTAVMMRCAPGSKLSNTYIGGDSNPCVQRYFRLSPTTCTRPGTSTTTLRPPATIPGGINIPTEELITQETRFPQQATAAQIPTTQSTAAKLLARQPASIAPTTESEIPISSVLSLTDTATVSEAAPADTSDI